MTDRKDSFLRRNAWPMGIFGILLGVFVADGILIAAALRDKGVGPEEDYYEKALRFDETRAEMIRAQDQGLRADISVAEAPLPDMPRRIDVKIQNAEGAPVEGLAGTLTAIRPSDVRLRNHGSLLSVPGEGGLYRLLLRLPVAGLWVFELEASKGPEKYRMIVRQNVKI